MNKQNADIFFKIVFAILGFMSVYIFTNLTSKVDSMAKNISELNTNVALMINDNKEIKEDLKDHEKRIRKLEYK